MVSRSPFVLHFLVEIFGRFFSPNRNVFASFYTFELNKNNPSRRIYETIFSASQAFISPTLLRPKFQLRPPPWERTKLVFRGGEHFTHFHRLFIAVFQSNFGWKLLAQFCLALGGLLFWGFMLHLTVRSRSWERTLYGYWILFFHSLHFCRARLLPSCIYCTPGDAILRLFRIVISQLCRGDGSKETTA